MSERPRGLVAQTRELANVRCDLGTDRLRRLPRLTPLHGIVAVAEDSLDLRVPYLQTAHGPAVTREAQVDRALELHDPSAKVVG